MTAQYRPYRDEDAFDDGQEQSLSAWDTQEPGTVKIYGKTTEELPIGQQRRLALYAVILVICSLCLGFILGCLNSSPSSHHYKASSSSHSSSSSSSSSHASVNNNWSSRQFILDNVDSNQMKDFIASYSRKPRLPSSPSDLEAVAFIHDYFIKHNLDKVEIKNYSVLLSLPDESKPNFVQIWDKHLNESVFTSLNDSHPSESKYSEYSAYSPAKSVKGDVVFVNYGQPGDYKVLRDLGIDLQGKIALAKQMNLVADEQVHLAELEGVSALLLYPDPLIVGPNFPEDAVRRDSLLWNNLGDPQTPGYPSTSHAYRIPHDLIKILPKIPVQPISLSSAMQILILLKGPRAPDNWIANTNSSKFDCNLGPGFRNSNYTLDVTVNNILEQREISNVIGTLRGSREPDRYVIVGNHRDSWSSGVIDSAGGTSGFLQLVSVFSQLAHQQGKRPRRSILFCSWGAEELNLMGSSEWIEEYTKILQARGVAYINTDILAVGTQSLAVASSPLLFNAVYNATQLVSMPKENNNIKKVSSSSSVYDAWLKTYPIKRDSSQLLFYPSSDSKSPASSNNEEDETITDSVEPSAILSEYINSASVKVRPKVRRLDMRSVCAPFFVKAGIPSIELTFVPTAGDENSSAVTYPLIHTQYDDIHLLEKFDPQMKYHAAATKVIGQIILDLADSVFLPFNLLEYAQVLQDFFVSLRLHSTIFTSQAMDLHPLESAIKNFTSAAISFHTAQEKVNKSDEMQVRLINDQLLGIERTFLDASGLPRNPSKKHLILSPPESAHHSYFDEMFPGLMDEFTLIIHSDSHSQSITWDILKAHFSILIYTIQSAADFITPI